MGGREGDGWAGGREGGREMGGWEREMEGRGMCLALQHENNHTQASKA